MNESIQTPRAPRISAYGRLWLREIGIDRLVAGARAGAGGASSKLPRSEGSLPISARAGAGLSQSLAPATSTAASPAAAPSPSAAMAGHGQGQPPVAQAPAASQPPGVEVLHRSPSVDPSTTGSGASGASLQAGDEAARASNAVKNVEDNADAKPSAARKALLHAKAAAAAKQQRRQAGVIEVASAAGPSLSAAALAGLDLGGLKNHIVGCTACGLCATRSQAVFGSGSSTPRWMVVGEAPGEQEDRQGEPFVGRAGQLLDEMLRAVGMSRLDDVFIANVIKCRPPANRNPKSEEIDACSPYLMQQISLLKPERILVLGRFAAQALVGSQATLGALRGRIHTLETAEGRSIPMVVSYHPAYLLRSPADKARAWEDLQLAATLN